MVDPDIVERLAGGAGAAVLLGVAMIACSSGGGADGTPAASATARAQAAPTGSSPPAAASASATASAAPVAACPEGMKKIEGGKLTMGSGYRPDELPTHEIQVASFCMDRTEVTTAAYEACMKAGKCAPPKGKHAYCNAGKSQRADHPINCVDWSQATAHCEWAGKRLPTEEEWEFAARGPEGRQYPWGDKLEQTELCWNGGPTELAVKRGPGTCAVGSFPAGDTPGTGLSDMGGNVTEWLSTHDCPYDPKMPCGKTRRGLRGGSWFDNTVAYIRATSRGSYPPAEESYFVGFRCARDPR